MPSFLDLRRLFLCLCVGLSGSLAHLQAQTISNTELKVQSATIQDGEAGIAVRDTFEFIFDRALPFSSDFNFGFHWEPRRLNLREYAFFAGDAEEPVDRKVRFIIRHEPDTDYILYVFGVLTCDNHRGTGCFNPLTNRLYLQKRPYVVNYTTAATMGTRDVSGTTTFGDVSQPPAKASRAARLRDLVKSAFSDVSRNPAPHLFSAAATDSLARTMVFLLDGKTVFDQNSQAWLPRSGAAPNANGAFTMNHVRDGVYWPVAVHFADRFGQIVGRYGYHDADGDFEPDSIVVSGGDVTGLKMVLMPDEPVPALAVAPTMRLRAQRTFPDAELITLAALDPQPDGTAAMWRYTFYSPSQDSVVSVDGGSFNTQAYVESPDPGVHDQLPLPESFVNSVQILQAAESQGGTEFRSNYPEGTTQLTVELGDLPLNFRPARPSRFWHVLYESPPGLQPYQKLEFFFDAETGAPLQGELVANETAEGIPTLVLGRPNPHPVRDEAQLTYVLREGGPVRLDVYDVLGRQVATLLDEPQPSGTYTLAWHTESLAPGTYLLRLRAGTQSAGQAVVIVR